LFLPYVKSDNSTFLHFENPGSFNSFFHVEQELQQIKVFE